MRRSESIDWKEIFRVLPSDEPPSSVGTVLEPVPALGMSESEGAMEPSGEPTGDPAGAFEGAVGALPAAFIIP